MEDQLQDALHRLLDALRDLRHLTGRRFTLDGFALGDLGEVVARTRYGVRLHQCQNEKGCDALAPNDDRRVEVKITQGKSVAIAAHDTVPDHLLVFRLDVDKCEVETVYNGPAAPAWAKAGRPNGRGQRRLSLAALEKIEVPEDQKLPQVDAVPA